MEPVKKGRDRPRKNAPPPPMIEEDDADRDPFDLSDLHAGQSTPEPPAQPAQPAPAPPAPTVQVGGLTFEDLFRVEPEKARGGRAFSAERAENKDTRAILQKNKRYKENFAILNDFKVDENAPPEMLELKLGEMRDMIGGKNLHAVFRGGYLMGVKGFEGAGCRVGLKLQGLSAMLSQSPEIDSILREIQCEMGCGFRLRPEQRLLMATLSSAMVVNHMNNQAATVKSFTGEPVKPELSAKYEGL